MKQLQCIWGRGIIKSEKKRGIHIQIAMLKEQHCNKEETEELFHYLSEGKQSFLLNVLMLTGKSV